MYNLNELLEKAIEIALFNHRGQVDKGGNPYILHALNVMHRLETIEEKIVGVSHDVPEDTTFTLDDYRKAGFPEYLVEGIDSVTHRKGESRDEYLYRAWLNPLGRKAKLADNLENSDLTRIPNPTAADIERVEKKYKREYSIFTTNEWEFVDKKWRKIEAI